MPTPTPGPHPAPGGFSAFSSRKAEAAWQDDAVGAYLSKHSAALPPASWYNASGRAIPDVAAFAFNQVDVSLPGRVVGPVSGTSAACPTVAALIGLANAARGRAGKPPLGPLNPLLYSVAASHPKAFADVTEGGNVWPAASHGYGAAPGWDAVTGLGSMKLGAFMGALSERGI